MNPGKNRDGPVVSEAVVTPRAAPRVGVFRRVLRLGMWTLAGLVAGLFALLLAVQSDSLSTLFGRWIAGAVSSEQLQIEVDQVTGSWVGGLTVTGLHASGSAASYGTTDSPPSPVSPGPVSAGSTSEETPPGASAAMAWTLTADFLVLRYRLLPLLRRTVSIREVGGSRVTIRVQLPPTGSSSSPDSTAQADTATSPSNWQVQVGTVNLRETELEIQEPGRADGDGWTFAGGRVLGHDLRLNPGLAMVVDTVRGDFRPPGRPEGWGEVFGSGRLEEALMQVDTFYLRSPESDVSAWGTVPIAVGGLVPPGLDIRFSARPFSLSDVGPLLPSTVSDSIKLDGEGFARSFGDTLSFSVRAEAGAYGSVVAEGAVAGEMASPNVRGRVHVEDLDLLAWGVARTPLSLSGDVDADGGGVGGASHGTADLKATLRDRATSRISHGTAQIRSDSISGLWRSVWSVVTKGVSAKGDADITLGARLAWEFQGQVSYDRSEGAPPVPGVDLENLLGSFQVEGRGAALDSIFARGQARVISARVGRADVDSLRMSGLLDKGEATFTLNGGLAQGFVDARGIANVLQRTGRILDGRLQEMDVAALLGDSVASSINASATGSLSSAAPLRGTASVTLRSSRYGANQLDSASAVLQIDGQSVDFRGRAALQDSTRVWANGRLEPRGASTSMSLDSLGYSHLDVRSLMGEGASAGVPSTDLNGGGKGVGVHSGEGWSGHAELFLQGSRVGGQPVDEASMIATLDSTGALVQLDFQTPEGGLVGQVRAEGLQDGGVPSFALSDVRFTALDPGALLDRGTLNGSLSGRVDGNVQGVRFEEMVGQARVDLDSSQFSILRLDTGRMEVRLNGGKLEATAMASAGKGGEIHLNAKADLSGLVPSYESSGTVRLPELGGGLEGVESGGFLFGEYDVEGSGFQIDSLRGQVSVSVDSAQWAGVPLDSSRLRVAVADGSLRVDTLVLESPAGSVYGGGHLPLEAGPGLGGELTVHAELDRADLVARVLAPAAFAVGSGVMDATATGSLDDLHLQGEAQVGVFLLNDLRVQGLDLRGEAHRKGTEMTVATGHLTVNQLQLPDASIRQLDVHADLEPGDELALTASADIDDLRNANLSAHLEGMWAASAIRLDSLEFHADQDHWRLARPSRITYRDGLEIDSLHLSAQGQEVTARGRISKEGPLSLQVALTDFDVTMVGDLMGYPDLRGTLNASVEFGGTAEDPRLDAQLHTLLDPASPSPVEMTVSSHYEERELGFDARVAMTENRGGRLTGTLPLALSFAGPSDGLLSRDSLQIEFLADSLPFGWASPLLPPSLVRNLEAVLDGSVQIRGVTDAPTFDGSLDLKLASVALPGLGVRYEQGQAGLTFSGDGVRLDSLLIRSGGGSLSGSGSVRLSPLDQPEVDLTFLAEQFQAVRTPAVDAVVSGTVGLSGPPARPSVSGRVEIDKANLYLADFTKAPDVRSVLLTEEDYREMASVFGYRPRDRSAPPSSLFEATSLDLDVELRRDSWVRQQSNPRLAVQFAGQMSVQKAHGDSLQLLGSIEGVPARSYVEQFGKRFSLADATLTFEGAPLSTQVVVKAEYEVPSRDNPDAPQVVIALNISGTPEFLSLELSSTPVLEASDMVSYLVTGRPADRSLEGGGGSLSSTGGALALSGLSGAVEAYAREQVGLDVVEITTDGLDGVTLVAGRFVSPSLYLGIRQPVSLQRTAGDASQRTPAPEIEVELEAIRWLLLNLQAGGLGGVQFYLRSRLAYD